MRTELAGDHIDGRSEQAPHGFRQPSTNLISEPMVDVPRLDAVPIHRSESKVVRTAGLRGHKEGVGPAAPKPCVDIDVDDSLDGLDQPGKRLEQQCGPGFCGEPAKIEAFWVVVLALNHRGLQGAKSAHGDLREDLRHDHIDSPGRAARVEEVAEPSVVVGTALPRVEWAEKVAIEVHIVFIYATNVRHAKRVDGMNQHHFDVVWQGACEHVQLDCASCKALDSVQSARDDERTGAGSKYGSIDGEALSLPVVSGDYLPCMKRPPALAREATEPVTRFGVITAEHGWDVTAFHGAAGTVASWHPSKVKGEGLPIKQGLRSRAAPHLKLTVRRGCLPRVPGVGNMAMEIS